METFSQAQLLQIFLTSTGSFLVVEVIRPFIKKCFVDESKFAAVLRFLAMLIGAAISCSIGGFSPTNIWLGCFAGGYNSTVVSWAEQRLGIKKDKEP